MESKRMLVDYDTALSHMKNTVKLEDAEDF
jgi:hypothetical protein